MTSEDKNWKTFRQVEPRLRSWLATRSDARPVHAIHFNPISPVRFEVYVFFASDADLTQQNASGMTETIRARIEEEFDRLRAGPQSGVSIRVEYDSHENVVKNYEGSYFFRLR